ncbi:MAG: Sapep family Mn(2+)-dependent dipeptidase [Clostridia bacterium]|nr:Sapep family Mn(2+)-dependent dipeptidase [Clostridia bacterium]
MHDFDRFLSDLKTLIGYKTTLGEKTDTAPFGEQNRLALSHFLSIAKDMGFATTDYDGYGGEITFGDGEEVGIIGHLDVVPTGIGWENDPFTLTEKNGVLYARGIVDDKTAPLQCLYALKELKDSGKTPKRKIRLFVGCDEESGWRDIDYMKGKTTFPKYGFSPDGNFPLSYAEKGITVVTFSIPLLKNFHSLKGGTVVNAVCDYATATPTKDGIDLALIKKHGLSLEDGVIVSRGKASHGSAPHLGKNAIKPLFDYFLDMGENVAPVIDYLFNDRSGVGLVQNEQGVTTLSPDLLIEDSEGIKLVCDCRIPAPATTLDLKPIFDSFGISYTAIEKHPPVMTEKDGWLVSALLSAYNSVMGGEAQPISLGGSTFARAFDKGVAFGPEFPDKEYNIHDKNECVSLLDLEKSYEIYKQAIFNLALK